jgi:uncharacterized protein YjdB
MKRQTIVLALILAALLFASCEDAVSGNPGADELPVAVTGVALDHENFMLVPGGKQRLIATVEPQDAANTAVTWKSDRETIATVDKDGTVTGVAKGTAVITVTTADGGKTAVCVVTVDPAAIPVTGVTIGTAALHSDGGVLWIKEGEIAVLTATVAPSNAANKAVTWESSHPTTAEIGRNNGMLNGLAAGSTTITVTTADGGFIDTCELTVKPKVTGVTLDQSLTLAPGTKKPLTFTVSPEGAPDRSVTWVSDKAAVATVDEDGTVTGVATGKAKITVTTADGGKTAVCEVTVTGVSLDHGSVVIPKGGSTTLIAAVLPEDAPDKSVTWKSNDVSVAAVDENGTVTGVGPGTTIITATMKTGSHTAECAVEVTSDEVTYTVNSTETWTAALAAISAAPDGSAGSPRVFVLRITGDFGVRGYSTTYPNIAGACKEVWLTGDKTISLDFSIEGPESTSFCSVLVATANQTFIIDGPTLKGNAERSHSLVNIWGGAVELRNGHLKDNTNCNSNGPGVSVFNGTFTMKGGTISGNSGGSGGGVYNGGGGTFIMDGGTITGNGTTAYNGGGVYFYNDNAAFIMNGGAITNNTGRYGGGVCVLSGTFTMNGGTISGNKAATNSNKNGVYYEGEDSFIRNGGEWQTD